MSDDMQKIQELHVGFVNANKIGDSQFLKDHMAPGPDTLVWYNLNQSNYYGVDHIVELWDTLRMAAGGKEARVEPRDDEITIVGDLALVTYLLDFEADFGAMGKFAQEARNTEVWRKMDGEWKMIHFHCSNYVPGVMGGK